MKTDGGLAFPMPGYVDEEGSRVWGMSQRDYFAGQALTGLLARDYGGNGDFLHTGGPSVVAGWAYLMADAMIAERNNGRGGI